MEMENVVLEMLRRHDLSLSIYYLLYVIWKVYLLLVSGETKKRNSLLFHVTILDLHEIDICVTLLAEF
jgi:hypothetical protein